MLRKIVNTGFARVLGVVVTFLTGVIISRIYGADGKGEITLLLLIPTLISTYFGFSINEGFLYNFGKKRISTIIFNRLIFKVALLFLPPFFLAIFLAYVFLGSYDYYLVPQSILMVVLFYSTIFKFSLRGQLDFKTYNLVLVLEPLITLLLIIVLIVLNFEAVYIIWAYVIAYAILLPYQYFNIANKEKISSDYSNFKDIFRYSYKVHFFKILNFTENKFDILIIGYFLSTSLVGIYSISIAISVIFQTIVQTSISTILFPVLIKTEIDKRGLLTQKYFKLSYVLAFLFFVALLLFGEFFIITVYGDEFQGAYIPVIVLAIGALVKSPAACINSFFKASGKPEELYKTSVYTVIVNIVLCIWLIPLYGIIGAAIASSISYFLYGFIMIFKFIKFTDTRLLNLIIIGKQDVDYIKRTIINRGE